MSHVQPVQISVKKWTSHSVVSFACTLVLVLCMGRTLFTCIERQALIEGQYHKLEALSNTIEQLEQENDHMAMEQQFLSSHWGKEAVLRNKLELCREGDIVLSIPQTEDALCCLWHKEKKGTYVYIPKRGFLGMSFQLFFRPQVFLGLAGH